ncbi:MAG: bifunctional phosphoribosylaminoimidazolecarboxamide formyltransferase/IMP cyclohydrolase [Thermoanaerobacterales bacterium]|nr:bifunctional phosphoribosylaminoimidazolecarboxamide formyltransferase/IMP cyclohydrolase [Thermoanaerobacterales bacterium]
MNEATGLKQAKKRAIISVSDKQGIVEFGQALVELGFHLVSTGGTARTLEEAGVKVQHVEKVTDFPEILGGRVKTLHPAVHAGILARDLPEDQAQLEELGIEPFSLVVVNLYPFQRTISKTGLPVCEALEQIDIGGPTMVRAAAKNFPRVAVVVNPNRYDQIIEELRSQGEISLSTRLKLAQEAFWHTAQYDAAISNYLTAVRVEEGDIKPAEIGKFPMKMLAPLVKIRDLRYGENPHQEAAFYREETTRPYGLASARQFHGKELSFNNILDLDAALTTVSEFEVPAAVVIKHNTPSGVACSNALVDAYRRAYDADSVAAYGGVVGLNRTVDKETAAAMAETFLEAVIAPAYSEEALAILKGKKNLRVLCTGEFVDLKRELSVKRVSGGFLLQDPDSLGDLGSWRHHLKVVTKRDPSEEEWEDLIFSWIVAKHVFSNAIVVAKERQTLGIGGGQVSRVAAARIALEKAGEQADGAVIASDGFLPFPDTIEYAAKSGIKALIQPGGSIRDEEVIKAADAVGMAMIFTGRRHFKH